MAMEENEAWRQYGLEMPHDLSPIEELLIIFSHSLVLEFLETCPDSRELFLYENGYIKYFEVLDIALGTKGFAVRAMYDGMDRLLKEAKAK
jgi:hypothetical protein